VPTIPPGALTAALGVVGAVIMPHNLFLHSSLVLTRKVDESNKREVNDANMYYTIESSISLFISFLINMSVIATFAAYS
jgi:natural resistance-associated macrophage protein